MTGSKWIGVIAVIAGAGLLLGACMSNSDPSGDVGFGPADGPAVEVVALDNYFEPDVIRAEAGEEITIEVPNEGRSTHDFAIEDLGINTGLIDGGEIAHATFVVPEGSTEFRCTLHGGMNGVIETD